MYPFQNDSAGVMTQKLGFLCVKGSKKWPDKHGDRTEDIIRPITLPSLQSQDSKLYENQVTMITYHFITCLHFVVSHTKLKINYCAMFQAFF